MCNGRPCKITETGSGQAKALFVESKNCKGGRVRKCLSVNPQKWSGEVAELLRLRVEDLPQSLVSLLSEHAGEPQCIILHQHTRP
jgi:hypothetical protein